MSTPKTYPPKYTKGRVFIHWASAILVFGIFYVGTQFQHMEGQEFLSTLKMHAGFGLLLLILTIIRTYMYYNDPYPKPIDTGAAWNNKLLRFVQSGLYVMIYVTAILGILTMNLMGFVKAIQHNSVDYISQDNGWLAEVHGISATILVLLALTHIVGVFRYIYLHKDNIIKRMSF